jgi:hypothetical protein
MVGTDTASSTASGVYTGDLTAYAKAAAEVCGAAEGSSNNNRNSETRLQRLRLARLHAAEAVKLSSQGSVYALAVLADVAYLHWRVLTAGLCAGTKRDAAEGVEGESRLSLASMLAATVWAPGGPAKRTLAAMIAAASNAVQGAVAPPPAAPAAASSGSSKSATAAHKEAAESVALHALAVDRLRELKAQQDKLRASAPGEADRAVSADVFAVFPLARIEARLMSPERIQALDARQKSMVQ